MSRIVVPPTFRTALQVQHRQTREMLQALDDGDAAIARECNDLSKSMAKVADSWPINAAGPAVPPPPSPIPPPEPSTPPAPPTVPTAPAPAPTPSWPDGPPIIGREVIGQQQPAGAEAWVLRNKSIRSDNCGILANRGKIDDALVEDVDIECEQYGIWADEFGHLTLRNMQAKVGGGNDPYGARFIAGSLMWNNVRLMNNDGKSVLRMCGDCSGVIDLLCLRGGQWWLGGGPGNPANDPAQFKPIKFLNVDGVLMIFDNPDSPGSPKVNSAIEMYSVFDSEFKDVTVYLPRGLGKKVLTVWTEHCRNVSLNNWLVGEWWINDAGHVQNTSGTGEELKPLGWEHIHNGDNVRASGVLTINQ